MASQEQGGTISIEARKLGEELQLVVSDDGPGIEYEDGQLPAFNGVGLANIRDRLEQLYGGRHSCEFSNAEPHGLVIEIRIPFETEL